MGGRHLRRGSAAGPSRRPGGSPRLSRRGGAIGAVARGVGVRPPLPLRGIRLHAVGGDGGRRARRRDRGGVVAGGAGRRRPVRSRRRRRSLERRARTHARRRRAADAAHEGGAQPALALLVEGMCRRPGCALPPRRGGAMTPSPRISVVVPNWNGRDLIDRCLESVRAQTIRDLEIIVVDNGSADGSAEHLRRHHPDVRLVALAVNQGFAGGVNAGVAAARGEFVALLNNDAWAAPDWLERLTARLASEPAAGACAPKIYRAEGSQPTGRLDSTGELYSIWGLPFPRGRDQPDRGQYDDAKAVFAVSGGASVYRS